MRRNKTDLDGLRAYDRGILRSTFASLFWAAIKDQKLSLQVIAERIGVDKSVLSRWFNQKPNWQIDTISDIAHALNLELNISARERETGKVVTPHGVSEPLGENFNQVDKYVLITPVEIGSNNYFCTTATVSVHHKAKTHYRSNVTWDQRDVKKQVLYAKNLENSTVR